LAATDAASDISPPARTDDPQLALDFATLSQRVKKRRLVLFFGRPSFSDNSKYLYLHALRRECNYEIVWCSADNDLIAQLESFELPCLHLTRDVDRSIDMLMHAAVAVFTVNPHESLRGSTALTGCLAGARKLQLWHGVSVKRLTLQLIPHFGVRDVNLRAPWLASSAVDYVLSTAAFFDPYWHEVFGCRRILRAGFPRNEVMGREAEALEMLGAQLPDELLQPLAAGRPNVLVVPTWQRQHGTALTESDFFVHALRFARANKVNFFFKMHPTYFKRWEGQGAKAQGLYLLDPGVDVYPWMRRFDALVTDYSSIMFDFLWTGKPVLALDLKPGQHQNFEPDYSLVPPGEFREAFDMGSFDRVLKRALTNDQGLPGREAYLAQLFETDPLQASAQIMALVDTVVEASQQPDYEVLSF
jgi:CDP-glycerol glycerophosphotransferase (TagB/SpsB family)